MKMNTLLISVFGILFGVLLAAVLALGLRWAGTPTPFMQLFAVFSAFFSVMFWFMRRE
ncbi:hypothetical protein [Pseudomonas sp. F1002]|uniref:hypothetical protein n=1 Tax=Pseudomonas sp. F1002 TaxID=2738821 RepID=UPI0015A2F5A0|nr:hypothetical protein [Pseudomonas sp. F1002]NWB63558.1 hypothetical protein [Pseudomonas sp. F1002]